MKKNIALIFLLIVIFFMLYKGLDQGVSYGYLKDDYDEISKNFRILEKYQRSQCVKVGDIDPKYAPFEQDGIVNINTISFKCITDHVGNKVFIYQK
jgi:hypothetical protein